MPSTSTWSRRQETLCKPWLAVYIKRPRGTPRLADNKSHTDYTQHKSTRLRRLPVNSIWLY
jgi:hypothetical protein